MAIHPNGKIAATGQYGKDPVIYIWNLEKMELITELRGAHANGVGALAFEPKNGNILCSVGIEDTHIVGFWDWKKSTLLASNKASSSHSKSEV
jgi:WD40 repeat protein